MNRMMQSIVLGFLLNVLSMAALATDTDALIIAGYQNCRFDKVTVFIKGGVIPAQQTRDATVEGELATIGLDFDRAVPAAMAVLKRFGVTDVGVERRGYQGCLGATSGKYVEAVASYCEDRLIRAEIRIDGKVFATHSDPKLSFGNFVARERIRLRSSGIWDAPRVVVNADECAPP